MLLLELEVGAMYSGAIGDDSVWLTVDVVGAVLLMLSRLDDFEFSNKYNAVEGHLGEILVRVGCMDILLGVADVGAKACIVVVRIVVTTATTAKTNKRAGSGNRLFRCSRIFFLLVLMFDKIICCCFLKVLSCLVDRSSWSTHPVVFSDETSSSLREYP
jgi:hypothetical protein